MKTWTVLLIEDDHTLVHSINRNLTARGYACHAVETVAAACSFLQEHKPHFIILDIDLPDGSGWEVIRTAHRLGYKDLPIIVMSALRPNPRLSAELECKSILEKPFPMESLLRLITQYI